MKYVVCLSLMLFCACDKTTVTEQEKQELTQSAKQTFPDKVVNGTRVTRNDEIYFVGVDIQGEKPVTLRCKRFVGDKGQYWNCQKPFNYK